MAIIEPSVEWILSFIIIALVLLSLFAIYLLVKHKDEKLRKRRIYDYKMALLPYWMNFLVDDKPFLESMIPKTKYEMKAVEEIMQSFQNNFSSSLLNKKIQDFSNDYMKDYYRKMLTSRRWSTRMNALYRIIDFKLISLENELTNMQKRRISSEEKFLILKFQSLYQPDYFLRRLTDWADLLSEFEYKKILMEVDSDTLKKCRKRFLEMPSAMRYSLIDTIGGKRDVEALEFISENLNNEDPEVRIRLLKALQKIGVIPDLGAVLPFLESELWEERMAAARLLKYADFNEVYPLLRNLLEDSSWWVRSQAAKTIAGHKLGRQKLQDYVQTSKDSFAIDMVNEVLWEGRE